MNDTAFNTYVWTTALLGGDQETTPIDVVKQALSVKKNSLLRLEWFILIKIAVQSEEITQLAIRQQSFVQYIEDLQLTLRAAKAHSPVNSNQSQMAEREKDIQKLTAELSEFQQALELLDQEIAALQMTLTDLQTKFRASMLKEFRRLAIIHRKNIDALIANIGNLSDQDHALARALYVAVRHPDVETELLASVKSQERGLKSKIKDWLSSPKFANQLQLKITQTVDPYLAMTEE